MRIRADQPDRRSAVRSGEPGDTLAMTGGQVIHERSGAWQQGAAVSVGGVLATLTAEARGDDCGRRHLAVDRRRGDGPVDRTVRSDDAGLRQRAGRAFVAASVWYRYVWARHLQPDPMGWTDLTDGRVRVSGARRR